ncbi:MAG: hypothetical protein DCC71_11320, partial [Proteobacteria bacterium]
ACALAAAPAAAAPRVSVTGPAARGPLEPDANGRFAFPSLPLLRNAVNEFTVTATDDLGNAQSQKVAITQIDLDNVVVSQVTSRPLAVQEIEQLVRDGVIDLEDPENYNVSSFNIVLTIEREEIPISIPIVRPREEPVGFEDIKPKSDPGSGGSSPRIPDTQIVVFEVVPPGPPNVARPRIPGVIIIQGDIKTLKEFFEVRLLLMNTSGIFTLADVNARIDFPEGGLSPTLPEDGIALFGDILPGDGGQPGQKQREFIVRGDEIGRRPIEVSFGGTITGPGIPEDEPIPFNGSARTAVEVKGPPSFDVRVSHPDEVQAGVPYELAVEITNTGEAPALYASLELSVGGDAEIVECALDEASGEPRCEPIEPPAIRRFGHVFPGARVREVFTVVPHTSGRISSCMGVADQNIALQVLVGNIGCITGNFPVVRDSVDGVPAYNVLPLPNAFGLSTSTPVAAFFTEAMNESTITTGGPGASFRVLDDAGEDVPGRLRFTTLTDRTIAIWQPLAARLADNTRFTVFLDESIADLQGTRVANDWTSTFTTTSSSDDRTPPQLTLSIEPPVDPAHVVPGEVIRVNAYPADQGTGVANVELRVQDTSVPGSPFQLIDQKAVFDLAEQGPCIFAVESANLVPGHTYQFRATAIDGAGNRQDATIAAILATTAAPPQLALPPAPADPVLHGISVPLTPISISPTVKSVAYYLDFDAEPFATVFVPPFQTAVTTLGLPLGAHTVRAVATDALGQTAEDFFAFELVANGNEPTVDFGGFSGGRYVIGSRIPVDGDAQDELGIRAARFHLDDPGAPPVATGLEGFLLDTSALAPGAHRLYLIATNGVGNANDPADAGSFVDFEVIAAPGGGAPPPAPLIASLTVPSGGRTTVSGSAAPGGQLTLVNATSGLVATFAVRADGSFATVIEAAPGDQIRASVLDLSQSVSPSAEALAVVPAPPALVALAVEPASLSFAQLGAFADLAVTASYSDGSARNVTGEATYGSGSAAVAAVSGGRVVAIGNGATSLAIGFEGASASVPVTVAARVLESISVAPPALTLPAIGASQALAVVGHYSDGTTSPFSGALSYSSSAPLVIGVTGNVVRAFGVGAAIVTVQASGVAPVEVPVSVDVAQDEPPAVAFQTPAAGLGFERGQSVSVTAFATDAVGVARVRLTASGAASFSELRPITPVATSASPSFSFPVPGDAPIGGTITLALQAEDTGGNLSTVATRTVTVVDRSAPTVSIDAPAHGQGFALGEEVEVAVAASDAVAVSSIRYEVIGVAGASGAQAIAPPAADASASFRFAIPLGLVASQVEIRAWASDAAGNEGESAPVFVEITGPDTTAPATLAIAASAPAGATTTVTYEVTDGLDDLDHVELYFRRNGIGTFNRYTGPLGDGSGEYQPQSGATGTIAFDATRSGGDGGYEFFTVGVDRAGNREAPPEDAGEIAGDDGAVATIATGAPVSVITSDTEIASDVLDGAHLRVDGATLTLVGARRFGNVELVNGAVLTHRETTQSEAYGLELTAWTVSVDATSRIDAVGRGHLGGNRSGLGETAHTSGFAAGSQAGAGGSYGGLGGDYSGNGANAPNPVYGNLVNPVDLGSGGGAWAGNAGGDGGGRLLVGAIHLAADGAITTNGGRGEGSAAGDGSGGSVNLTLRTLSGRGAISADGGTANGASRTGGGGGRIAIRALDRATHDAALLTARGGDGYYGDGADGTIFLLGEGETGGELVINGLGAGSPSTDLLIPPGQSFDSITLQNGANVIAQGPIVLADTLRLRGNSTLAHPTASEAGLSITARDVIVEPGSAIDVTGRGYRGGLEAGLGETAHTLGFAPGSPAGSGGSHGGAGGNYSTNLATPVYGDPKRPSRLGAGGGAWAGNRGGAGGGFVRIVADDRVVVDGAIRANGGLGQGSAAGDGAGGSIWIDTVRLSGTGAIAADGGTAHGSTRVGGGGGRIAIYAELIDPNADLGGLRDVTARGGDGYYGDAAAGTLFVHLPGDADGTLVLDGVMPAGQTQPRATELPPIGPGVAAAVTADTLTLDGRLPRAHTPNALVGLRVNPDVAQAESFEIASNTADAVTVVTPNENGVAFADVAAPNASYAGEWRFDAIRLQRGAFVEAADPLVVADALAVTESSVLAHPETTGVYAGDLVIDAGSVAIDATSRIDVTGRGHLGGGRSGLGSTAHTAGFAPGSQEGASGSHGGLGGHYASGLPNPVYGDARAPHELGSGGGSWAGNDGGDGGGRVVIVADALVVDGALRADGGASGGSAAGDGSGGSLDLRVGSLSGTGTISASGGTANGSTRVGGGGGRIAIRHGGSLAFPLANVRATGGDGYYGDGGHGSVFVLAPGQTHGDYVVDGKGFTPPADSVVIPDGLVADNVILRDGVLAVATAITADTLRLESGATLTHAPQREQGLRIDVRELHVASGAAIDASARGYLGGNRAGYGETAQTLGGAPGSGSGASGSHGGAGGQYSSSGPAPIYGDPRQPTHLGGGGGAWSGAGGDGGGALRIVASESVTVDGAIRANGGISGGSASGEGAGGSVWIETATIGGAGTISADGGTRGGASHVGGGGGRVAIYADEVDAASDLLAARRATAYGGDGYYGDGAPGTVFVALGGVETLIFDAGRASDRWTPEASLPPIGPGVAAAVGADSLTLDGSVPPPGIGANHLVGLRVNPNTTQSESFAIVANTADTLRVATPNENGAHFADVAIAGAPYAAAWRVGNVELRGGASVALFDPIAVDDTLTVAERSLLAHPETTQLYEAALEIVAGSVAIDATSAIDVSARGYLGGTRSGLADGVAHTLGFAPGAEGATGGSYGGLGGDWPSNGARIPNPVYGDAEEPFELGSGGGAWSGPGGDGGGRVRIVTGTLLLDGAIRADGGLSSGSASGEGSGGAVNVRAATIEGSGAISAHGGTTNGANHVGGGGGRIAIRTSASDPLPVAVGAQGGDGYYADAQPGSVVVLPAE